MISTEIEGDPERLVEAARWIRESLAAELMTAAVSLDRARADDTGWRGQAGDAFRARMTTLATPTKNLQDAALNGSAGIDAFAAALSAAQSHMARVRSAAQAAGLVLTPFGILPPIPAVAVGRPPAPDAPLVEHQLHAAAVSAHRATLTRWEAFDKAAADVAGIRHDLAAAHDRLIDVQSDVEAVVLPSIDVLLASVIESMSAGAVGALSGQSRHLLDQAARLEANTRAPTAATNPSLFYRDLDDAARLRAQAVATSDDAARAVQVGKGLGMATAGLMTGVGVYMDIQNGESAAQAATSNLAGLGASIAAGAATGAIIGSVIPGPGTAVGAVSGVVVGAVVGIFASGAVDSLFENGPDVGAAIAAGGEELAATGRAFTEIGAAAGAGIADAAAWAGDGLIDAWDSVFG